MRNTIKNVLISIIVATTLCGGVTAVRADEMNAVTRDEVIKMIDILKKELVILMNKLVEQLRIEAETKTTIQPNDVGSYPTTTMSELLAHTFAFDVSVNGVSSDYVVLPSAPYTRANYPVKWSVTNGSVNSYACQLSGFYTSPYSAVSGSFTHKFLDKQLYTLTIQCTNNIDGSQSSKTITVDTR
jgi:hypothetical protein